MEKVQRHLQCRLPAKKAGWKTSGSLVWAGASLDGKAGGSEPEPPVAQCVPAHAVRAAGLHSPPRAKGSHEAAKSWQACEEEGERVLR